MYIEPIFILLGALALHWLAGILGDVFRDTKFGEYMLFINEVPIMLWVMALVCFVVFPAAALVFLVVLANWVFGLCLEGLPCG